LIKNFQFLNFQNLLNLGYCIITDLISAIEKNVDSIISPEILKEKVMSKELNCYYTINEEKYKKIIIDINNFLAKEKTKLPGSTSKLIKFFKGQAKKDIKFSSAASEMLMFLIQMLLIDIIKESYVMALVFKGKSIKTQFIISNCINKAEFLNVKFIQMNIKDVEKYVVEKNKLKEIKKNKKD